MYEVGKAAKLSLEAKELLEFAKTTLMSSHSSKDNLVAILWTFHSVANAAGNLNQTSLEQLMLQLEIDLFEAAEAPSREKNEAILLRIEDAQKMLQQEIDNLNLSLHCESKSQQGPASQNVLLVDDEAELLTILSEVLESACFTVELANSAREALRLSKENQPDAIITDVTMPEMNGLEFLKLARAEMPNIPIIFISGNVTKASLFAALEHGVSAVLEKPLDHSRVIENLKQSINSSRLNRLMGRSLNLIANEFSNVDRFLAKQGKEFIRLDLRRDLDFIKDQRKVIQGSH